METEPKHTEQTEPPFGKYSIDPDTLLRKRVRKIDGVSETLSEEEHIEKDGSSILKVTEYRQKAADGMEVPVEDFIGWSWTNKRIPRGCAGKCINPYDLHKGQRLVYIDEDGVKTDEGNILCDDCNDLYKRKMGVVDWIPFFLRPIVFLFWEPEIL
jgi:hypothetical protein